MNNEELDAYRAKRNGGEKTIPVIPLQVRAGFEGLERDADHKTFGIDVAYIDWRGKLEWHCDMIKVYSNKALRDAILQRLQP